MDTSMLRKDGGPIGRPQDVAEAIAALISNGFISGQLLVCDGGLRLG